MGRSKSKDMIYQALEILRNEFGKYMEQESLLESSDLYEGSIILGNIGFLETALNGDGPGKDLHKKIVFTLAKVGQEDTLRNLPNYMVRNQQTVYKNPPVTLNLFLLITTGTSMDDYFETALKYLSHVVEFFQGKNVFTSKNTPDPEKIPSDQEPTPFKLIVDLYSPSFEEANYIWSTLGGRQLPYVCYKVRLVEIERDIIAEKRKRVEEVSVAD